MEDKAQQNIINTLYIILIISTVLSFVPHMIAQVATLPLIILVLIAAYIYKGKDSEDGLLYNHMTYLIGTIWIGSTFLAIGVMAASYYVYLQGDHTVLKDVANQIYGGYTPNDQDMMNIAIDYMQANKTVLILGTGVFVGPAILYFIYRIGNGYSRAIKGYRIANPKSWL